MNDSRTGWLGRHRMGVRGWLFVAAMILFLAWVGKGAWDEGTSIDPLRMIRSSRVDERERAAANLRVISVATDIDSAMAALLKSQTDSERSVRGLAITSLGDFCYQLRRRGANTPAEKALLEQRIEVATRALAGVLSSAQDTETRAAAARALGMMATQNRLLQPPPALAAALEQGSVRWSQAFGREYYGLEERALPPELVGGLRDPSAEVRAASASALVHYPLNLDAAMPALFSTFEHAEPALRDDLRRSLRLAFPTAADVPALVEALKDGDRDTRTLAAQILGNIGPEADAAVPALLAALPEPGGPGTKPTKGDAIASPDRAVMMRLVASALGNITTNEEVISTFTRMLSSDDADLVRAAVDGLHAIGRPAAAAIPALISVYKKTIDKPSSAVTATEVATALARIASGSRDAHEVIAILIQALDSKSEDIRFHAIRGLGKFGASAIAAVPKLMVMHQDRDSQVRSSVTPALDAIWPEWRSGAPAAGSR